jgi:hypothetical protein
MKIEGQELFHSGAKTGTRRGGAGRFCDKGSKSARYTPSDKRSTTEKLICILKMRGAEMIQYRQRRGWLLIAAIAIGFALVCMLIPHGHSGSADWLVILPLVLAGVISPLSLFAPLAFEYTGRASDAPLLPTRFQRPPPFRLA